MLDLIDDIALDDLSPMLRELAGVIGIQDTLKFMRAFSGRRVGVPSGFQGCPDHPLVERLGEELASKILDFYAGQCVQVPCGRNLSIAVAKRRAYKALASGELNYSDIAERCGVHVRTIYQWIADLKSDGSSRSRSKRSGGSEQLSLFGD
jgi:hypothetical protein